MKPLISPLTCNFQQTQHWRTPTCSTCVYLEPVALASNLNMSREWWQWYIVAVRLLASLIDCVKDAGTLNVNVWCTCWFHYVKFCNIIHASKINKEKQITLSRNLWEVSLKKYFPDKAVDETYFIIKFKLTLSWCCC